MAAQIFPYQRVHAAPDGKRCDVTEDWIVFILAGHAVLIAFNRRLCCLLSQGILKCLKDV